MNPKNLKILLSYFFFMLSIADLATARTVVDQIGQSIDVPEKPLRVVSLAPGLTEMVFSLQAGERIVGATRYSNYPEAAKKIPRVGSYIQLDLERIVALRPDLCIATKDGNPRHTVNAVKDFDVPVFVIDPRNLEQIMKALTALGDILGQTERATELVTDMQNRIDSVTKTVAKSPERPGVFFQISDMPIVSSGKNSFIDKLITLAGGVNLAGTMSGYPRYSWENIILLAPEVVIISSMVGGTSAEDLMAAWQQWEQIPAVINKRVYVVDADLFNRPTARLVSGLEILAEILHPKAYGETGAK